MGVPQTTIDVVVLSIGEGKAIEIEKGCFTLNPLEFRCDGVREDMEWKDRGLRFFRQDEAIVFLQCKEPMNFERLSMPGSVLELGKRRDQTGVLLSGSPDYRHDVNLVLPSDGRRLTVHMFGPKVTFSLQRPIKADGVYMYWGQSVAFSYIEAFLDSNDRLRVRADGWDDLLDPSEALTSLAEQGHSLFVMKAFKAVKNAGANVSHIATRGNRGQYLYFDLTGKRPHSIVVLTTDGEEFEFPDLTGNPNLDGYFTRTWPKQYNQ